MGYEPERHVKFGIGGDGSFYWVDIKAKLIFVLRFV